MTRAELAKLLIEQEGGLKRLLTTPVPVAETSSAQLRALLRIELLLERQTAALEALAAPQDLEKASPKKPAPKRAAKRTKAT